MTTPTATPETITCEEARERLGMGRDAFYQAVSAGNIVGFYRWGERFYGIRAQFDAWMSGQQIAAQTATDLQTAIAEVEKAISAAELAISVAIRAARGLTDTAKQVEDAKALLPFPLIARRKVG